MQRSVQSAILASCLFAIGGLIIPSQNHAIAASAGPMKSLSAGKIESSACSGPLDNQSFDHGCKPDSNKTKKVDLDRKGHKVKKSSRGR